MIIAINAAPFIQPGSGNYLQDYFLNYASAHPTQELVFIGDYPSTITAAENVVFIHSKPAANNSLLWKYWLNYTLPAIARRQKASLLIHLGNAVSLRTRLPQWMVVDDLSYIAFPNFYPRQLASLLKKNGRAFINKAVKIIALSDFLSSEIQQKFQVPSYKIQPLVILPTATFQSIGWEQKELTREKYASGKEYFLFCGALHGRNNLINLLKAFTFFKTRQKSNMQLVICTENVPGGNSFVRELATYKFRREVILLTDLPEVEKATVMGAAYAFVYPSTYDGTGILALQAMQCGIPVITGNNGVFGLAEPGLVLTVDPTNYQDIAYKMMVLFKEEDQRNELIGAGRLYLQQLRSGDATRLVMEG